MRALSKKHKTDQEVKRIREVLKKDPVIKKKFKEYDVSLDDIDNISIEFCPLDVSAKTKNRKIYLNEKLLDPDNDNDPLHYAVHECIHYLQQTTGKVPDKKESGGEDYLDLPTEEEAFEAQIDYKKREDGEREAEDYVDELLDYHKLRGKKRENKKEELMDGDEL